MCYLRTVDSYFISVLWTGPLSQSSGKLYYPIPLENYVISAQWIAVFSQSCGQLCYLGPMEIWVISVLWILVLSQSCAQLHFSALLSHLYGSFAIFIVWKAKSFQSYLELCYLLVLLFFSHMDIAQPYYRQLCYLVAENSNEDQHCYLDI